MPIPSQKTNISRETMSAIFIAVFVALFILANFAIGFSWPLYLLAMVFAFAASVRFPKSGLLALVFLTIIFERFFTLQTIFVGKVEYKLYPLDIVLVGIILGIIWHVSTGLIKKMQLRKVDYVLLAFIFLNSVYFIFAVFILQTEKALAFSTLKNYGFYSLLYFITAFLIRSKDDLQKLFKFFLAGAIGIIIFIIIGIFRGQGLWSEFTPLSTSGIRILAFTHGLYLTLAFLPLIIDYIYTKNKSKIVVYILSSIWLIGIVGTMMRHLWIALAVALAGVYLLLEKNPRKNLRDFFLKFSLPFAVVAIVIFYVISMAPQSRLNDNAEKIISVVSERAGSLGSVSQDESYSWRVLVWESAYTKFKQNPLFGIGTGKRVFVETQFYRDFIEVRNIHNSYLAILIQLGAIGFGLFVYWLYANIKNLLRAENSAIKYMLLSSIVIYVVALNFQPYLETNLLALFFWITLGLTRNHESLTNFQSDQMIEAGSRDK